MLMDMVSWCHVSDSLSLMDCFPTVPVYNIERHFTPGNTLGDVDMLRLHEYPQIGELEAGDFAGVIYTVTALNKKSKSEAEPKFAYNILAALRIVSKR